MTSLKKIFFLLLCTGMSLSLSAQSNGATETREVLLRIQATYKQNDTVIAFLSGADSIGLVHGQLAKAFQTYAKAEPGVRPAKEFAEIGSGYIYLHKNNQTAFIRMYKPADTLMAGDVIQVKLQMPKLQYRGIFSDLAFNNIIFYDIAKAPLYSFKYLLTNDSRKVEDSILNVIAESLHSSYETIKNMENIPPVVLAKIADGRFRDRRALDVIRDVTQKEIEYYLLFVKSYPGRYIGRNFRADETFATWLINNGPYSTEEIKQALFPYYKNKEEFRKKLLEYRINGSAKKTASSIVEGVVKLSANKQYKEAHELADFAMLLAEELNDTLAKPTTYIFKAQVFQDEGKLSEAIVWCDKTIKAASLAKDRDIEMQAVIKKGYCFFKISKYKEAEEVFKEATVKLDVYRKEMGESKYDNSHRKIFEYRSTIQYKSGKYDQALRLLDTAIIFNKKMNTYDALVSNAGHYTFKGRVNNDQGRPTEALEAFEQAAKIYRDILDVAKGGEIENNIAYSYYKLGKYRNSIERAEKAFSKLLKENDLNSAGYSKSLIGSNYWELGRYDSAVASHKQSLELRKQSGNKEGQASSWYKIGDLYQLSGSKYLSLQAFDTAINLYREIKDSTGLADVYNAKGKVHLNDENYKKATDLFEMAKGISNKSTIEALYNLGMAWHGIDTSKARKYYLEARKKSKEDGNTSYQFSSSRSLATLAYYMQDTAVGDRYYDECVSLSDQMKTADSKAYSLSLKAYRYETITELDSALHYYRQSRNITDSVDKSQSVTNLNSIARVHIAKGEFKQADEALNKAITLSKSISDSLALGSTLDQSTFLYSRTAEFDRGLVNSDNAIAIFTKSGHLIRLANTYGSRGVLFSGMGDYKKSVMAYLYADSLYKEELQEDQRGMIFNNIGVVYIGQSDYNSALKYLQKALSLVKKGVVNESYLITQGNIAECLLGQKKQKEAQELLLDVLPKAQKMKLNRIASGMATVLGKLYLEQNKLKEAAEYYGYAKEYALASGEQDKLIEAFVNLGRISYKEQKIEEAKSNLQQSVALTQRYKIIAGWESYYELGLLYYNQQLPDSAIVYFKQAIELLDRNAANLYGGDEAKKIFDNDPRKSDLYNKLVFAYYSKGDIKEAWAYANRSNIAGIKELSGSLSVNSSDKEKNEALHKIFAMQESKKALESTAAKQEGASRKETLKKIEILEADYTNFLQDVVVQYPDLNTYFTTSNADEFNNYKGKLPDDVAVVLYLLNDKTLMIFTLTNEKLAVDTMTLDIAPRINTFIETIKNTKKSTGTGPLSQRSDAQDEEKGDSNVEFKDISEELYNALITTVADKIEKKKRLCIIPTGVFSNMPFQCLGKKLDKDNFRFLANDYQLFYTNKMSVFNNLKDKNTARVSLSSFAAFGVPDATLRYNITEVKAIGKILGADSTVYADSRATESMAKSSLRNKRYIHFATHGILNYSSDYSQSYLKLLPDKDTSNGNNGQLTMREVQRLGIMDCEMVILSACQTAVSKQLVKGWNISPANSFLVSKVKTVVASLWKVADEPTGLLMEYFYENLNKQMDKAEALQLAQIKLSQDARYKHPNYWGAFVLYGEWR